MPAQQQQQQQPQVMQQQQLVPAAAPAPPPQQQPPPQPAPPAIINLTYISGWHNCFIHFKVDDQRELLCLAARRGWDVC
jgi:hypothetical protein